jgi:ATP-dependent DNA ligase
MTFGSRVWRIKTRHGYDWTDRFLLIVESAERLRASRSCSTARA